MKSTRYLLALTLVLVLAAFSKTQAQSPKKMLTKTWVMSVEEMVKRMPEEERKQFESMSDEQRAMMKKMMDQGHFSFKPDGTFEAFMQGKKEVMTWKLTNGGKQLVTTEKSGKVTTLQVLELSKSLLVLKEENDNGKSQVIAFIPKSKE